MDCPEPTISTTKSIRPSTNVKKFSQLVGKQEVSECTFRSRLSPIVGLSTLAIWTWSKLSISWKIRLTPQQFKQKNYPELQKKLGDIGDYVKFDGKGAFNLTNQLKQPYSDNNYKKLSRWKTVQAHGRRSVSETDAGRR